MESALLVVIDTRVASPAVVEECIRAAQSENRVGRSLFVAGENGLRPAIDAISFDYPEAPAFVRLWNLSRSSRSPPCRILSVEC
jgi:hypothetical protein